MRLSTSIAGRRTFRLRDPHGKAFQKFADRVCKIHEFDRLTF
jgi:hypothetical protein